MPENINIPDSNITANLTFRKLVFLNMQKLTNFPYIEADFDALTNYQLICKVVEYLNSVIDNSNEQNESIENLYNAFLSLQNYVNNTKDSLEEAFNDLDEYVNEYFTELNVQTQINNKLDAMVEDGTLAEIINQEIFGEINSDISTIKNNIGTIANLETPNKSNIVNSINSIVHKKYVLVGDSYLGGYDGSSTVNSWGYYFQQYNNISNDDIYIFYESGAGFYREGSAHNYNFKKLIQGNISQVTNPSEITDVIICGGVNDHSYDMPTIRNAMVDCLSYVKTNFPNADIYVGCISTKSAVSEYNTRQQINNRVLQVYKECNKYGAKYLTNIELVSRDYSNFGVDGTHLLEKGYQLIGAGLMNAMKSSYSYIAEPRQVTIAAGGSIAGSEKNYTITECFFNEFKTLQIREFNLNDITPFAQSGQEIILSDANSMELLYYLRNTYSLMPTINCEMEIHFSDSQYDGYYPGALRFDNSGRLCFATSSVVNGKTITSIRLWYAMSITVSAVMN